MADEISMNTAVVFNQLESTYGVSPGAMTASQAVLIKSMTAVPLTGNRVERDLVKPYFGANPGKLTAQRGTMQFTVEATGAGETALDAGTPPAFGRLLRQSVMSETMRAPAATIAASPPTGVGGPTGTFTYAAGDPYEGIVDRLVTLLCTTGGGSGTAEFTVSAPAIAHLAAYEATEQVMTDATDFDLVHGATITPTVGTAFEVGDSYTIQLSAPGAFYTPESDTIESGESFFQYGPNRHQFLGQRGNVTINAAADGYFDLQFDFMGLPGTFSSEAIPTVDFSAFQDPLIVDNDNSPYVALGGVEIVLRSFNLNVGQNIVMRSLVGQKKVRATDRAASGTIVFEAPGLDDADYFANLRTGATLAFELIHGLLRGEIVHLTCPQLEITGLQYQDEEGVAMFSANITALPSDAGNDELTLAIK
ncbi:hypothetical protein [Thalassobaculum litoreum]|uniref:Uncharacterized protein n=1 Tax=Thalassobaculum litoreum DSM 18839 TaxID=1123362 RepID=A0A8G2BMV7_9PROT|nr:hypothetical protein [Thalassobaculum litoreum]SDG60798.1 hypothetical protein SAMN05660686_05004 [Thalassobaculum litoreum DSM 18839]